MPHKSIPISDGKTESHENPRPEESNGLDSQSVLTGIPSENVEAIKKWIERGPDLRKDEISYLVNAKLGSSIECTDKEDLRVVFTVSEWYFLLVLDSSFPRETEGQDLPIKVYLVTPGVKEFKQQYNVPQDEIPDIQRDTGGVYLVKPGLDEIIENYRNRRHSMCLSKTMIEFTEDWVSRVQKKIEKKKSQIVKTRLDRFNPWCPARSTSNYEDYYSPFRYRPKYVDGRASCSGNVNPWCQKIVLSDRAFIQIFNESKSRIMTETGGLLLGHYDKGIWYVIEASDPGINAVFRVSYHESDNVYQNHVCDVISRTYKKPLVFLGMWHRHPGSLDTFSGTDDQTNNKYAASVGNGCISAIINYDPEFRITFYYVEQDGGSGVRYTKVDIDVGDDKIQNKEMMMLADMNDVISRMG